jgi:hypothetical protein
VQERSSSASRLWIVTDSRQDLEVLCTAVGTADRRDAQGL